MHEDVTQDSAKCRDMSAVGLLYDRYRRISVIGGQMLFVKEMNEEM